jgi:Asparagine synthase
MTLGLTPRERASGLVIGRAPVPPLPHSSPAPLQALERVLAPVVLRGPCFVAFSGGLDSSFVLAAAARAARAAGADPPVPLTVRFGAHAAADESAWQEAIVRELGLADWERVDSDNDFDLLGPVARRLLELHGPLWPPNVYTLRPLLELARGGTLLTGIDGDALLGGSQWVRAARVLGARRRPTRSDLKPLALAVSPSALRRPLLRRFRALSLPWLHADTRAPVESAWARQAAQQPVGWDAWVRWYAGLRQVAVMRRSLELVADGSGARICSPLLDAEVIGAVATAGGFAGFESRAAALVELFGDLLPRSVRGRQDKAEFGAALWGPAARSFGATCDDALLPTLVDPEVLRSEWGKARPDLRTAVALHDAWLRSGAREPEEPLEALVG